MGYVGRCEDTYTILPLRLPTEISQDLVSRLTADNPATNNGVLQVAHSIFKRWRPLYRSDPLFTEINHVLGKFGAPFLRIIEVLSHIL